MDESSPCPPPDGRPSMSLFFPVYNDEKTVRRVALKSVDVLSATCREYEILIINDGSPDRAGEIADELAREFPGKVRAIHHPRNLGYGAAVRTGLSNVKYEWVCFTDGDDEYDVFELYKMLPLLDFYDLIITFRYVKAYSGKRQFISWVYNCLLRFMFRTRYRDISTGFRVMRRSLAAQLDLRSNSTFIGAEIAIKTMLRGYRVGEVGIQTFPRQFGKGSSTTIKSILDTISDLRKTYKHIFSRNYQLPSGRNWPGPQNAGVPPNEARCGAEDPQPCEFQQPIPSLAIKVESDGKTAGQ
jgi:glycosyltransferase involved in cell wall biosynthesis